MSRIPDLSVSELLAGMRRGDFSAVEVTRAFLEVIERLEPSLHTLITFTPELALRMAEDADRRYRAWRRADSPAEEALPPLLGIPLMVKDVLCLKGVPCTCGSRILQDFIPPYTATAVQRLLDAGVVVLGKTNTDEFAMGSSTENSAFGATRNPWNPAHVPGGSSGGSASAVAARMTPAALGSDTGGSIRQPAAYCGVTGIKPTYGRVSRYGLVAYGSSLDTVGVFARSAAETALFFSLMAGHDPLDSTSAREAVSPITLPDEPALKGLRIGVPQEYFIPGMSAEVEQAVRAAIAQLEHLGATVQMVRLPHTEYALPVYYLIAPAEASANLARYDGVRFGLRAPAERLWEMFDRTRGSGFGAEVKRRIMLGTYALSAGYYDAYYAQAQKVRTLIRQDFLDAFQQVDVIACPVAPTPAFRLGEHTDDPLAMYLEDIFTLPANLAGVPGLAFPAGFSAAGLPIGIQLMSAPFREEILFQTAHAYQQVTDWHLRRPPTAP
ncbi:Asp-tRNA(Asn)/Glu-tRNA(Gln) amidotransferase subunit GatA [Anaerolinea thermophila]|uniref:Glutamyl-tRNA(Gln) amidotransferase subunit A n=1 Tax=Anaerolinea thermophila (strain DSM 14523 / JCM 11388 / NBRC 100420 / UNI-1) TaxID=926569 RepID=E8N016_ANATU|nr:Asp-tRNA(Asn)/Glu-tRNA(Gln) amidotransferase subunit GatA [Anaerolinea thermophila]BAJ62351.1 aspartyl/glutamyl-tRNA(Asn/Gln) amidotransferase subunit A [Anaerolinea thermophila UNI-1]